VNSFLGGSDEPTGSLLSAPFLLDRPLLSFLIGGSGHLETVRLELLVDGRVERAATGSFTEFLERRTWDVGDLAGREARLRAVDESSDEWGHLLLDDVRLHERLRR
jgi:fructan beta-fructosidase